MLTTFLGLETKEMNEFLSKNLLERIKEQMNHLFELRYTEESLDIEDHQKELLRIYGLADMLTEMNLICGRENDILRRFVGLEYYRVCCDKSCYKCHFSDVVCHEICDIEEKKGIFRD